MYFKYLLIFLVFVFFGCDESEKNKINKVAITHLASDYPFEVEDYGYGKDYNFYYPYYSIGDTLHFQIDLEVTSGQLDFVDLYAANGYGGYYSVDEWLKEESESSRVIDFNTYYFKDNKLSVDYELVVNSDMILKQDSVLYQDSLYYRADSTVNIFLDYGKQLIDYSDHFNLTLYIKP